MNENNVSVICESCGAKNNVGSNFCASCGKSLGASFLASEPTVKMVSLQEDTDPGDKTNNGSGQNRAHDAGGSFGGKKPKPWFNYTFDIREFDKKLFDPSDKEVSEFLGSNQDYYFSQFNKMKSLDKSTSWNWVAFFFPILWLAYRKMYVMAILTFVVSSILGSAMNAVFGLNIALALLWGFFGNVKYLEYIENAFIEAEMMDNKNSRASYLKSRGGTNVMALVIIGLLTTGFIIVPMMLAIMFFFHI